MFFVTGLRVTKTVHAEESCRSWKSPDKASSARRGGVCVRRLSGVCFLWFLGEGAFGDGTEETNENNFCGWGGLFGGHKDEVSKSIHEWVDTSSGCV